MSIWKAVHWQLGFWNEVIKFMKTCFYLRASVFLSWGTPECTPPAGINRAYANERCQKGRCICPGTIKHLCITQCSNALVPGKAWWWALFLRGGSHWPYTSLVLCHLGGVITFILHRKLTLLFFIRSWLKGNPIFISVVSFHFFSLLGLSQQWWLLHIWIYKKVKWRKP